MTPLSFSQKIRDVLRKEHLNLLSLMKTDEVPQVIHLVSSEEKV